MPEGMIMLKDKYDGESHISFSAAGLTLDKLKTFATMFDTYTNAQVTGFKLITTTEGSPDTLQAATDGKLPHVTAKAYLTFKDPSLTEDNLVKLTVPAPTDDTIVASKGGYRYDAENGKQLGAVLKAALGITNLNFMRGTVHSHTKAKG